MPREMFERELQRLQDETLVMGSMVENAIYRYKAILGRHLWSRCLKGQRVEVQLGCGILNRMAQLGMPESRRVA